MASKTTKTKNDVVDISLSAINKKKIRIDGDDSRILELNTSDLGIFGRLKKSEDDITQLTKDAMSNWPEDSDDDAMEITAKIFENTDKRMREIMDFIFDAPVSELCAPTGTMFDPINGKFRYEHIMDVLGSVYETDIESEVKQMSSRVKKHTDKYTK